MSEPQDPQQRSLEKKEFWFLSSCESKPKFEDVPNEDTTIHDAQLRVYAVFDGMGGYAHGEKASQIAAETIMRHIESLPSGAEIAAIHYVLEAAYNEAHEAVISAAHKLGIEKMGTTGTTLLFRTIDNRTYGLIAHVGDSRVYRFRDGVLLQITRDDSLLEHERSYLESRGIDVDEIAHKLEEAEDPSEIHDLNTNLFYKKRNVITQSIGRNGDINIHFEITNVIDGDIFIICSDGVSDNLTFSQIRQIVCENRNPAMLSMMLVESAKHIASQYKSAQKEKTRAKPDDTTAIVIAAHN